MPQSNYESVDTSEYKPVTRVVLGRYRDITFIVFEEIPMRTIIVLTSLVCVLTSRSNAQDATQNWNVLPNFPLSDVAPTVATPTLPDGLTLAPGAVSKADYDFTPVGNVRDRPTLDSLVYYQSIYGNQNVNTGNDGIEGDTASNWTRPRVYPASSPYNLLNFTSDGLNLGVTCSQNNTAAGCTQGNIYGTLVRFPTAIQLGDIGMVRIRTGASPLFYQGPAEYAGVQKTPGARGQWPYSPPASLSYDWTCYGENDLLDDYLTAGVATGHQLKIGVEPIYSYAQNTNHQCYTVPPHVVYASNGWNFQYFANTPWTPYFNIRHKNTSDKFHTIVWTRPNDGSHLIHYYYDGAPVLTEYYEQSPTNPGWSLVLSNQTIPAFLQPNYYQNIQPNDGGPIVNGAWSMTVSNVKIITGTIIASKLPGPNGANNNPINNDQ